MTTRLLALGLTAPLATTLTAALALAMAPTAHAGSAPRDLPTEDAETVRVVQEAADYDEVQSEGCRYSPASAPAGSLDVECSKKGVLWLDHTFTVPREAINVRATVKREVRPGSPGRYVVIAGARPTRTSYEVTTNVARGTEVRLDRVRLRYDLPTRRDRRPCVTPGEWAAIDVGRGGTGGTKAQVAAVFDHKGRLESRAPWSSGFRAQERSYPRCDSDGRVTLFFHQYRGQKGWHSYWG